MDQQETTLFLNNSIARFHSFLLASYLVHSGEKVSILCEVVASRSEPQPAVIVYPRCKAIQADDENFTIGNHVSLASLQLENLTIANLVINYFGTTTGATRTVTYLQLNLHIYVCAGHNQCKTGLDKGDPCDPEKK